MKKQSPIELIHVSDIHFGSGESHGKINPSSGLNIRLEDFCAAFAKCVDYALELPVDVFLFSGDAYRNASPEPIYQKLFAQQLRRLSQANIKTILVVGNHDQIFKSTGSHSMSVFQSLGVPNLVIIDRPQLLTIDTAHGALQIVGLPYVTRHIMMTHEQYADLPNADIERVLSDHIAAVLSDLFEQLDPKIPAIATAHIMIDRARAGAEQELLVGYTTSFPMSMFTDERLEYVALGHVHKHQVLRDRQPAIVYAGSIERVDFSEEAEDKGFVHVQIMQGKTNFKFHSIQPRGFETVDVDVTQSTDPTEDVVKAVKAKLSPGCVMRARYKIREEQTALFDDNQVRHAAAEALTIHLKPDVVSAQRESRIPQLTETAAISPLSALETYLDQVAPDRKSRLLSRATELWNKVRED